MQSSWAKLASRILAAVLLCGTSAVYAQIADLDDGINAAGRLRMLSQRVAKAYLQIGKNVDEVRSRAVLDASIAQFGRHLAELKQFAPTPEIGRTYAHLEISWLAYKALLAGSEPNQENARRILTLADEVLVLADRGADQLEALAGTERGRLLNLAGRQRMLSQRMAVQYHAVTWGIAPPAANGELDKTRREFVQALGELSHASGRLPHIRAQLKLADRQWLYYDVALDRYDPAPTHQGRSVNIATTSERTLEVMEQVTEEFERIAN